MGMQRGSTWISAASQVISVSLPRSICSATRNSFSLPTFACMNYVSPISSSISYSTSKHKFSSWMLTSHRGDSGTKQRPISRKMHGTIPSNQNPTLAPWVNSCSLFPINISTPLQMSSTILQKTEFRAYLSKQVFSMLWLFQVKMLLMLRWQSWAA